jgi:putative Holliday junction resolvase
MRVLALDFGSARCGCAISDPTGAVATPLPAVERPGSAAGLRRIAGLVREHAAASVVVGLPLTLAGGESDQTRAAREFAAVLADTIAPVSVELYDERLTTAQAQRAGGEADEDSRAAAHLLEAWLAHRRGGVA